MRILTKVLCFCIQNSRGQMKPVKRGTRVKQVPLNKLRHPKDKAGPIVRNDTFEHIVRILGPGPIYKVTYLEDLEDGRKLYFRLPCGAEEGFLAINFIFVK